VMECLQPRKKESGIFNHIVGRGGVTTMAFGPRFPSLCTLLPFQTVHQTCVHIS
jgi:hypothetical protein